MLKACVEASMRLLDPAYFLTQFVGITCATHMASCNANDMYGEAAQAEGETEHMVGHSCTSGFSSWERFNITGAHCQSQRNSRQKHQPLHDEFVLQEQFQVPSRMSCHHRQHPRPRT